MQQQHVHRFRTTIRVNESAVALARSLAERYGVGVSELIEIMLAAFAERADEMPRPTAQREGGQVIDRARNGGGGAIHGLDTVQANRSDQLPWHRNPSPHR